jgi:hypothetical protein
MACRDVDGFIAAPSDDMRWIFDVFESSPTVEQIIKTTGAIVTGRRTCGGRSGDAPPSRAAP